MIGEKIVKVLFNHPSPIIVIYGSPETGKTDFALLLVQKAFEKGLIDIAGSNAPIYDDRFVKISSLKSLELWLNLNKKKNKAYILDEADTKFTNLDVITKLFKRIRVFLAYQHRKFKLKVIIIYHRIEDLPKLFADPNYTLAYIKKLNKKTALIKCRLFEEPLIIRNVPKTNIQFDTYVVSDFTEEEEFISPLELSTEDISNIVNPLKLSQDEFKIMWEWAINNKTCRDFNLHPQQFNRLNRKFCRKILEFLVLNKKVTSLKEVEVKQFK